MSFRGSGDPGMPTQTMGRTLKTRPAPRSIMRCGAPSTLGPGPHRAIARRGSGAVPRLEHDRVEVDGRPRFRATHAILRVGSAADRHRDPVRVDRRCCRPDPVPARAGRLETPVGADPDRGELRPLRDRGRNGRHVRLAQRTPVLERLRVRRALFDADGRLHRARPHADTGRGGVEPPRERRRSIRWPPCCSTYRPGSLASCAVEPAYQPSR
jgi:hypothetical protein